MSGALLILIVGGGGAAFVILLAKVIVDANDGFSLGPAIGRGIAEGLAQGLEEAAQPGGAFDKAIDKAMREVADERRELAGNLRPSPFVWQMAFEFMRTDRSMTFAEAQDLAVDTLKDFLRDEKIKFGNPGYGWDQSCAITLARECQTDYWERAS